MAPTFNTGDITRLRKQVPDSVLVEQLAQQDQGFNEVLQKYKTTYVNPDPFTAHKAPTYLINRYYFKEYTPGRKVGTGGQQTGQIMQTMSRQTKQREQEKTVGGFLGNVVKSGGQFIGDVASAVAHPIQTGKALAQTAIGGAANTLETITGNEDLFNLQSEDTASQVGQFFKERYGSAEALGNTMYNDPVGFLADLSAVLSLGGGALRVGARAATAGSQAVNLSSTAAKVGKMGTKAVQLSRKIDPMLAMGRSVGKVGHAIAQAPDAMAQKGVKSALSIKPSDVERIQLKSVAGVKPEKWLLDNGLIDEFGATPESLTTKLSTYRSQSKSTLEAGLAKIQQRFDIRAKQGAAPAHRVGQALDILDDLYTDSPGNEAKLATIRELKRKRMLSLSEINEVKRLGAEANDLFRGSGDLKAGVKIEGLNNIRGDIKTFIERQAAANGMKNVKELNKGTQVAKEIEDAITSAEFRREPSGVRKLVDIMVAGLAGFGIDPATGVAVYGTIKVLESPRVKLAIATAIKRLSKAEQDILRKYAATRKLDDATRAVLQKIGEQVKNIPEALQAPVAESLALPERSQ